MQWVKLMSMGIGSCFIRKEVALPQMFDSPLHTTDQSIDRVLNAGLPVVLVFVDGLPQPAMQQAMERLAKQYAGQLLMVRVPVADSPLAVRRYGVNGFPALVTVKAGQEQSRSERILHTDLEAHTAYLLGKGSKPAPSAGYQTSSQRETSGNGRSHAPGTQSYPGASGAGAYSPGGNGQSTGGRPVTVTDASFEQEVMRSSTPVLVDFWAAWCGPCRTMEPVLQKLAGEMAGRLKIAKLNVDENPVTGGRFSVQAIPTMLLVKDGRILDRWSGAMPESMLRSRLAAHLR